MAQAEEAGVPDPDVLMTAGDSVTRICAVADDQDVDVIVVGSHDKTALRRLFDPSVAAGATRSPSSVPSPIVSFPSDSRCIGTHRGHKAGASQ
jgi:nucleotide-binding universal stress UspA family protein